MGDDSPLTFRVRFVLDEAALRQVFFRRFRFYPTDEMGNIQTATKNKYINFVLQIYTIILNEK